MEFQKNIIFCDLEDATQHLQGDATGKRPVSPEGLLAHQDKPRNSPEEPV